jgi:threonine dehydratase
LRAVYTAKRLATQPPASATSIRVAPPVVESDEGLLPSADDLERARHLCKHFERAYLEEVRLVRFGPPEKRTWLALESMQVTGSFKVRGALLAIARRKAKTHDPLVVVAASAGNHGAGVAYAAKHLGVQAEIVVPRGAPKKKIARMEDAGATVIISSEEGYDAAEKQAQAMARERGVDFISPYDDLDVLTGNGASIGFEITRALGRVPGVTYCPIGGGGLATGLACAFRHELAGTPASGTGIVLPVQSEASCAFAQSLERGSAVTELPPEKTLAEGLEGGISERAFARASSLMDQAIVCTEQEIARALKFAARELGIILEGSAAVSLVPALDPSFRPAMDRGTDTVIVLTGRNIDADRLMRLY